MISESRPQVHFTKTGIPVRNLWHMLLYVWDVAHMRSRWKSDAENAPTLDALLASILASLIRQRLRIGLGRDYRHHSEDIAGVRGRVNFNESLKRLSFQHGRAYCQFPVFTANVPKNQIVRSTLARLVQIGEFGSTSSARELRARLRRLVRDMDSVDVVELEAAGISRERRQRHDTDYRLMLAICHLLLQRQMPTEIVGVGGLTGLDRDAFTLHDIYEKFVARFYGHHLHEWHVSPQQKLAWPTEGTADYLPAMYPDLTLQHKASGHIIVLDTKFTAHILVSGWGKKTFNSGHLFQLYAYLKSQEHRSANHRTSTGVLLYPTVDHELSETVRLQGHSVCWETIDLALPWEQIEERLQAIPAKIAARVHHD